MLKIGTFWPTILVSVLTSLSPFNSSGTTLRFGEGMGGPNRINEEGEEAEQSRILHVKSAVPS